MDWDRQVDRRFKLRDLQFLHAAVEAGSMMKAAANLGVSQPAISYAIAQMEHSLGVPLLDRSSQGVAPTIYGKALLERSAAAFNELQQGVAEIASLADPAIGELRIGTTPPMSAIASAVFNLLVRRYPRMVFDLNVGATESLLHQLRRRDIELVISRLADFVKTDDLNVKTLFHDELAVICGKHNKWSKRRGVLLADLVSEPWIFPPVTGFLTKIIRGAFEDAGLQIPRATVTTTSTYALSVLAGNGPFLAMHPGTMLTVPTPHPQLVAVDVRLPTTRGPIGLIALNNRSLSSAAKLFVQSAAEVSKTTRTVPPKRRTTKLERS